MLLDIKEFQQRTRFEIDRLIDDLVLETRRSTPAERIAWRSSLPAFANVLAHPLLAGLHVHVGQAGRLMVEYNLPASPCWTDLVMLGRGPSGPAAVVIELKDWNISRDKSTAREALVQRVHGYDSHPSDQVRGYVEYCRRFHNVVQELKVQVDGCVYFTFASDAGIYVQEPHHRLIAEYPVFVQSARDVTDRFPRYLSDRIVEPDPEFANSFERGVYKQDRGFCLQVSRAIKRSSDRPFVLLGEQRRGFELCMACVERRLRPAKSSAKAKSSRSVVVIEGPPGSGKSVIAAQLWASMSANEMIDGNVVLTTTSTAQRTNWEQLFHNSVGKRSARGVVIGSTQYNPGLNQQWLKREREAGFPTTIQTWRANVERYREQHATLRCADDAFAVSIVDEAHALIDPTAKGREGMSASGWLLHAGPQAWHVIRSSRVSIFLLDPEQSYRDNETTTVAHLERFAKEFDADFTRISLAESQFRCAGSTEYIDWVDLALQIDAAPPDFSENFRRAAWRNSQGGPYEFEIFDTPFTLEGALRPLLLAGRTARLVSSYARKWKSKGTTKPHALAPEARDFCIEVNTKSERKTWSRIWNYTPGGDYSIFIQAPQGSAIATDQLCEVGCPYVLRGFDFDYVGLLWMSDLVWRNDRWKVDLAHVHESAWRLAVAGAKKRRAGAEAEVIRRLQRGYRILMSRAMRGTYVWFEDQETREHIERLLRAG